MIELQHSQVLVMDLFLSSKRNPNNFKFKLLPRLAKVSQSLPTSSSDIQQSFSQMKFVKTLLRKMLKDQSLEAIPLIVQEYNKKAVDIQMN